MAAPDVGVREATRAMKMGALGVQIYTNVAGKPLDNPEFEPFWKAMNETGTPIWLHPSRTASFPDYQSESKSKYEIWWTLGWSYETAAAMSRLVFSGIMDKYPKLKIITHHMGGIVPMLEGRIGPGWDQIGARTSDEDYQKLKKSLKKRPLDYFKESFYCDSAVFGGKPATECGLAFYPNDRIVFASDCPFDPEKGTYYIRETLKIFDGLDLSKTKYKAIMHGNLESDHRPQAGEVVSRLSRHASRPAALPRPFRFGAVPSENLLRTLRNFKAVAGRICTAHSALLRSASEAAALPCLSIAEYGHRRIRNGVAVTDPLAGLGCSVDLERVAPLQVTIAWPSLRPVGHFADVAPECLVGIEELAMNVVGWRPESGRYASLGAGLETVAVTQQSIQLRLPWNASAQPSCPDGSTLTRHQPSERRSRTRSAVPFGIVMIREPCVEVGWVRSAR